MMRTGARETMRPVHTNHRRDCVAPGISTLATLMGLLLWIVKLARGIETIAHDLYDIKNIYALRYKERE
jgi:hypothetical protein